MAVLSICALVLIDIQEAFLAGPDAIPGADALAAHGIRALAVAPRRAGS